MRSSDALEALYGRHSEPLLAFFARRTPDPQVAADLWAETFAQTVAGQRRRDVLSGDPDRDAAFLYAVARRQLALYHRRGYAERRALGRLKLERPELDADAAAGLERLAEMEELRDNVAGAVAQLPAEQQAAVRLRVVDGESYPTVAASLAISEPAARARVSRGLRALAVLLRTDDRSSARQVKKESA